LIYYADDGDTHDLAGLSMLVFGVAMNAAETTTLATATIAIGSCLTGAAVPDLDQPTAGLWHKIPAGSIIGRLMHPLLGNHRMLSHSLVGMALFGWGMKYILAYVHTFLLVDMNVVWRMFMLGLISHLFMDTPTKEGVPWLFPIPVRIGIPPLKLFRITTASWVEKLIVFPGILAADGMLITVRNYDLRRPQADDL
jgi:inner membrane protein